MLCSLWCWNFCLRKLVVEAGFGVDSFMLEDSVALTITERLEVVFVMKLDEDESELDTDEDEYWFSDEFENEFE